MVFQKEAIRFGEKLNKTLAKAGIATVHSLDELVDKMKAPEGRGEIFDHYDMCNERNSQLYQLPNVSSNTPKSLKRKAKQVVNRFFNPVYKYNLGSFNYETQLDMVHGIARLQRAVEQKGSNLTEDEAANIIQLSHFSETKKALSDVALKNYIILQNSNHLDLDSQYASLEEKVITSGDNQFLSQSVLAAVTDLSIYGKAAYVAGAAALAMSVAPVAVASAVGAALVSTYLARGVYGAAINFALPRFIKGRSNLAQAASGFGLSFVNGLGVTGFTYAALSSLNFMAQEKRRKHDEQVNTPEYENAFTAYRRWNIISKLATYALPVAAYFSGNGGGFELPEQGNVPEQSTPTPEATPEPTPEPTPAQVAESTPIESTPVAIVAVNENEAPVLRDFVFNNGSRDLKFAEGSTLEFKVTATDDHAIERVDAYINYLDSRNTVHSMDKVQMYPNGTLDTVQKFFGDSTIASKGEYTFNELGKFFVEVKAYDKEGVESKPEVSSTFLIFDKPLGAVQEPTPEATPESAPEPTPAQVAESTPTPKATPEPTPAQTSGQTQASVANTQSETPGPSVVNKLQDLVSHGEWKDTETNVKTSYNLNHDQNWYGTHQVLIDKQDNTVMEVSLNNTLAKNAEYVRLLIDSNHNGKIGAGDSSIFAEIRNGKAFFDTSYDLTATRFQIGAVDIDQAQTSIDNGVTDISLKYLSSVDSKYLNLETGFLKGHNAGAHPAEVVGVSNTSSPPTQVAVPLSPVNNTPASEGIRSDYLHFDTFINNVRQDEIDHNTSYDLMGKSLAPHQFNNAYAIFNEHAQQDCKDAVLYLDADLLNGRHYQSQLHLDNEGKLWFNPRVPDHHLMPGEYTLTFECDKDGDWMGTRDDVILEKILLNYYINKTMQQPEKYQLVVK